MKILKVVTAQSFISFYFIIILFTTSGCGVWLGILAQTLVSNASPGMAKESSYSPKRKLEPREKTAKDSLRLFHDEKDRVSLL